MKNVKVLTFKDVNVEELAQNDLELPKTPGFGSGPAGDPPPSDRSHVR